MWPSQQIDRRNETAALALPGSDPFGLVLLRPFTRSEHVARVHRDSGAGYGHAQSRKYGVLLPYTRPRLASGRGNSQVLGIGLPSSNPVQSSSVHAWLFQFVTASRLEI